jgi:hypothetical protein
VTGAPDGAWIRQRIFAKVGGTVHHCKRNFGTFSLINYSSKLSVHEQTRGHFSIYPSEVGSYALGGALSDRRLHALCRESGDPSGSLKLFVSTSPDRPPSADSSLDAGFTRERIPVSVDIHTLSHHFTQECHPKGYYN